MPGLLLVPSSPHPSYPLTLCCLDWWAQAGKAAPGSEPDGQQLSLQLEGSCQDWMAAHCASFLAGMEACGWDTGKVYLPAVRWTAVWA